MAASLTDIDVIACTGDSISNGTKTVPQSWNEWPQQFKLMVRGNHIVQGQREGPETFVHLTKWVTKAPWYCFHQELSFIGLDYERAFYEQLEEIAPGFELGTRAVVVLAHKWPQETDAKALATKLPKCFPKRPILYLHGHDHRIGAEWEPEACLDDLICCRSKIISCTGGNRGCAHFITWNGQRFFHRFRRGFPLNKILG